MELTELMISFWLGIFLKCVNIYMSWFTLDPFLSPLICLYSKSQAKICFFLWVHTIHQDIFLFTINYNQRTLCSLILHLLNGKKPVLIIWKKPSYGFTTCISCFFYLIWFDTVKKSFLLKFISQRIDCIFWDK